MKNLFHKALGGLAIAAALLGPAQATPLSALLGGGSIAAGSLVFDNWTVLGFSSTDGRAFDAATIEVSALPDGGLNPGPGLRFDVSANQLSITGDDAFAFVDLMFGFRARILGPGLAISDNSLFDLGAFVASTTDLLDGFNDDGSFIRETLGTLPGLEDLGVNRVEYSILDSVQLSTPTSHVDFAPQREVWVTKNVIAWAVESTDSAGVFTFSQRFSQHSVPEPASAALVLLALAGVGAARRRR